MSARPGPHDEITVLRRMNALGRITTLAVQDFYKPPESESDLRAANMMQGIIACTELVYDDFLKRGFAPERWNDLADRSGMVQLLEDAFSRYGTEDGPTLRAQPLNRIRHAP